jgi:general secretion pathway protein A
MPSASGSREPSREIRPAATSGPAGQMIRGWIDGMYAQYFGLRESPFNNTPDPRYFFATPDHEEAKAAMVYAVMERKGFVLLTGEVGAGKTMVTRMMLRHFGSRIEFADIHQAIPGPRDLMESILTELELPFEPGASATQLVRTFEDHLLARFARGIPVVLVLDEAQDLPVTAFEQLRMIGNLESEKAKLLQVVMVGQPELQRRFQSPDVRPLRQRLFRSFHLPALSRQGTEGYIRHRLRVAAGHPLDLFDDEALEAIFRASHGLPRLINTICDNLLLSAYAVDRRRMDGPFTRTMLAQIGLSEGTSRPPEERDQEGRVHSAPADGALAAVTRHEAHLRKLAGTLRTLIRGLRAMLDRAEVTASSTILLEGEARSIHDRLVAQTRRSQQLINRLEIGHRTAAGAPIDGAWPMAAAAESVRPGWMSDRSSHAAAPSGAVATADGLREMLLQTRENLAEMRELAQATPGGVRSRTSAIEGDATEGLVRQVDELLQVVAEQTSSEPSAASLRV